MIGFLEIRDFVIVDHLTLPLAPGMSAMTGETGAGKSIIVDALGLLLGDRADAGVVRAGSKRAELSATFDLNANPRAREWLEALELDEGDECLLRRTINGEGGSRGYINGRMATVQQLRDLGELLVDIHGQHQHQSLLRRDAQRALLDEYAGNKALTNELARIYGDWKTTKAELERLRAQAEEREARLDFLRYQVVELEALKLEAGEWQRLEEEHRRLAHMDSLLGTTQQAVMALEDDDQAIVSGLQKLTQDLSTASRYDASLQDIANMLNEAAIQAEEAAGELRRFVDRVDLEPERLAELEERIAEIHGIARKHRVEPEELPDMLTRFSDELAQIENADVHLDRLQKDVDALARQYEEVAAALSQSRAKAAERLAGEVTEAMQELGMPGGRFQVALEPLEGNAYSAHGLERITYLVAANPGQTPSPLSKVASGGELSRISLAIQVITAQIDGVPTLVFDEVDVGIGGGVAEIVGEKLRALGERRQVLCITHLPQVAAQAHAHMAVSKSSDAESAKANISLLSEKERANELARMLGGVEITSKTLAHAREMLKRAQARDVEAVS